MHALRKQSEDSFEFVKKARSELPVVEELKFIVGESTKRTSLTGAHLPPSILLPLTPAQGSMDF